MTNVEVLKECGCYDDVRESLIDFESDDNIDNYINSLSRRNILKAYLSWNGLYGYAGILISLMTELVNHDETNMSVNDLHEIDFDNKCDGSMVDY